MDYSKLSDFEINSRVLALKSGLKPIGYAHNADNRSAGVVDLNRNYLWYDFCNNPVDAWPIIVDKQIDIIQDNGQGCTLATSSAVMMMLGEDVPIWQDENPLRAAMIVYLMMQGG